MVPVHVRSMWQDCGIKIKCFQRQGKQLLEESFRVSVYVCIFLENTKQKVLLDKLSYR